MNLLDICNSKLDNKHLLNHKQSKCNHQVIHLHKLQESQLILKKRLNLSIAHNKIPLSNLILRSLPSKGWKNIKAVHVEDQRLMCLSIVNESISKTREITVSERSTIVMQVLLSGMSNQNEMIHFITLKMTKICTQKMLNKSNKKYSLGILNHSKCLLLVLL